MIEEWREAPGFSRYEVSNLGRIRNVLTGSILKTGPNQGGYIRACLWIGRGQRHPLIHRLVALAFLGPSPDDKPEVNHLDSRKDNNRWDNLEWASRTDQMRHAVANGTHRSLMGSEHPAAKFTDDDVRAIRRDKETMSLGALARRYDVSKPTIKRIGIIYLTNP